MTVSIHSLSVCSCPASALHDLTHFSWPREYNDSIHPSRPRSVHLIKKKPCCHALIPCLDPSSWLLKLLIVMLLVSKVPRSIIPTLLHRLPDPLRILLATILVQIRSLHICRWAGVWIVKQTATGHRLISNPIMSSSLEITNLCILVKMAATSYVGLQRFCKMSRHSSPVAYTFGWNIVLMNFTPGGFWGYCSSKCITSLNVPSSKGVSDGPMITAFLWDTCVRCCLSCNYTS